MYMWVAIIMDAIFFLLPILMTLNFDKSQLSLEDGAWGMAVDIDNLKTTM